MAEGVVATALPILAVSVSRDPLAVASIAAAQHLPWVVVALVWHRVSRRDRRTVIGLVDTARALMVGWLGFTTLAGTDTIRTMQIVALVVGLGEALTGAVEEETGDTSRLSARGMVGIAAVGMPLGGVLYELFAAVPFLADVLFFALAALFALFVPRPVPGPVVELPSAPRLAPGTSSVAGVAFTASVARSAVLGILVLFALEPLGLGAPAFGLVLAGLAAATAAGAWIAPETGAALGLRRGYAIVVVLAGAALFTAAQVASPERPWAAVLALGIAWALLTTGSVLLRAMLRLAAGRAVTGPALRGFHVAEWAGVVLGALAGGWLARRTGVHDVIRAAAAVAVVAAVAVSTVRPQASKRPALDGSVNLLDAA